MCPWIRSHKYSSVSVDGRATISTSLASCSVAASRRSQALFRFTAAFRAAGSEVVATHYGFETDETVYFNVSDPTDAKNFDVKAFGPQVVVHCAAMTNVDQCEKEPSESRQCALMVNSRYTVLSPAQRRVCTMPLGRDLRRRLHDRDHPDGIGLLALDKHDHRHAAMRVLR